MIHVLQRPDFSLFCKVKVTWHTAKVWWPILRICALHLPIQSAHTHTQHTHTHTPWTHTHTHTPWAHRRRHGQPFMHLGVRWLAQGHLSRVIEGERVLYIHSPHLQFLPARDSNPQPLCYESDSLPLGHDLNCNVNSFEAVLWYHGYTIVHKGYNNKSTPINRN